MSDNIRAYAAHAAGGPLQRFDFDPGPLGDEDVEITHLRRNTWPPPRPRAIP